MKLNRDLQWQEISFLRLRASFDLFTGSVQNWSHSKCVCGVDGNICGQVSTNLNGSTLINSTFIYNLKTNLRLVSHINEPFLI